MTHFVFCHGFGFNNYFWEYLAPFFARENCSFIDLGYFNQPSPLLDFHGQKIIGIGHSLGLSKLIGLYENFECLIGLNGFINFLGNNQVLRKRRQLELKILEQSFIKNRENALKNFYNRCGVSGLNSHCTMSDLNLNLVLSDLKFLNNPSYLPSIPTLILASNDDPIVTKELIGDNFFNHPNIELDIINHAKHGLGFIKSLEVYERVMSFLDDNLTK